MNTERAIIVEKFYEHEFPEIVKSYYDEFSTLYPNRYKCLGIVDLDGQECSLFEYIENFIRTNYNIPYEIQKDLSCHNAAIFFASTNNFGFTYNANNKSKIPEELLSLYSAKAEGVYTMGLFSHIFSDFTGLSKIAKEKAKANIEVELELVRLKLRSYLKRFFMHGGIDWKWIVLDQIYHYGVDKFPNSLDHNFKQLKYSIGFSEKYGHLWQKDGETKEKLFYSELKEMKIQDYSYLNVLAQKLLSQYISKKNKIYANCESLGEVPIIRLIERPGLLGQRGSYEESYYNYLKYTLDGYQHDIYPYDFPIDFKLNINDVFNDESFVHEYLETFNEPENGIRALFGLPRVGEGWISETNLFYEIKSHFLNEVIVQHGRPKWLGKQHLDIYIPKYNVGVEYQGDQHFYPIEYFGGELSFVKNQERDIKKKVLCENNNCRLIYVTPGYKKSDVLDKIESIIGRDENNNPLSDF